MDSMAHMDFGNLSITRGTLTIDILEGFVSEKCKIESMPH